jgi:hypothetical protein
MQVYQRQKRCRGLFCRRLRTSFLIRLVKKIIVVKVVVVVVVVVVLLSLSLSQKRKKKEKTKASPPPPPPKKKRTKERKREKRERFYIFMGTRLSHTRVKENSVETLFFFWFPFSLFLLLRPLFSQIITSEGTRGAKIPHYLLSSFSVD